jgi:hypothetical protein
MTDLAHCVGNLYRGNAETITWLDKTISSAERLLTLTATKRDDLGVTPEMVNGLIRLRRLLRKQRALERWFVGDLFDVEGALFPGEN